MVCNLNNWNFIMTQADTTQPHLSNDEQDRPTVEESFEVTDLFSIEILYKIGAYLPPKDYIQMGLISRDFSQWIYSLYSYKRYIEQNLIAPYIGDLETTIKKALQHNNTTPDDRKTWKRREPNFYIHILKRYHFSIFFQLFAKNNRIKKTIIPLSWKRQKNTTLDIHYLGFSTSFLRASPEISLKKKPSCDKKYLCVKFDADGIPVKEIKRSLNSHKHPLSAPLSSIITLGKQTYQYHQGRRIRQSFSLKHTKTGKKIHCQTNTINLTKIIDDRPIVAYKNNNKQLCVSVWDTPQKTLYRIALTPEQKKLKLVDIHIVDINQSEDNKNPTGKSWNNKIFFYARSTLGNGKLALLSWDKTTPTNLSTVTYASPNQQPKDFQITKCQIKPHLSYLKIQGFEHDLLLPSGATTAFKQRKNSETPKPFSVKNGQIVYYESQWIFSSDAYLCLFRPIGHQESYTKNILYITVFNVKTLQPCFTLSGPCSIDLWSLQIVDGKLQMQDHKKQSRMIDVSDKKEWLKILGPQKKDTKNDLFVHTNGAIALNTTRISSHHPEPSIIVLQENTFTTLYWLSVKQPNGIKKSVPIGSVKSCYHWENPPGYPGEVLFLFKNPTKYYFFFQGEKHGYDGCINTQSILPVKQKKLPYLVQNKKNNALPIEINILDLETMAVQKIETACDTPEYQTFFFQNWNNTHLAFFTNYLLSPYAPHINLTDCMNQGKFFYASQKIFFYQKTQTNTNQFINRKNRAPIHSTALSQVERFISYQHVSFSPLLFITTNKKNQLLLIYGKETSPQATVFSSIVIQPNEKFITRALKTFLVCASNSFIYLFKWNPQKKCLDLHYRLNDNNLFFLMLTPVSALIFFNQSTLNIFHENKDIIGLSLNLPWKNHRQTLLKNQQGFTIENRLPADQEIADTSVKGYLFDMNGQELLAYKRHATTVDLTGLPSPYFFFYINTKLDFMCYDFRTRQTSTIGKVNTLKNPFKCQTQSTNAPIGERLFTIIHNNANYIIMVDNQNLAPPQRYPFYQTIDHVDTRGYECYVYHHNQTITIMQPGSHNEMTRHNKWIKQLRVIAKSTHPSKISLLGALTHYLTIPTSIDQKIEAISCVANSLNKNFSRFSSLFKLLIATPELTVISERIIDLLKNLINKFSLTFDFFEQAIPNVENKLLAHHKVFVDQALKAHELHLLYFRTQQKDTTAPLLSYIDSIRISKNGKLFETACKESKSIISTAALRGYLANHRSSTLVSSFLTYRFFPPRKQHQDQRSRAFLNQGPNNEALHSADKQQMQQGSSNTTQNILQTRSNNDNIPSVSNRAIPQKKRQRNTSAQTDANPRNSVKRRLVGIFKNNTALSNKTTTLPPPGNR
jgi:hypothetical protein